MADFKTAPADAPVGVKLMTWVDNRFPASKMFKEHMSEYYAPKNLNFFYIFGALSLLVLVIQIVTGIFLVMHSSPTRHWPLPRSSTSCATCPGAG